MSTSTNVITPDLQAKLDKAREEIHSGQCITLKSHDDIDNYLRVYDLYNHYFQECRRCHQEMEEIQSKAIQKYQKIYHELVDHPRTVPGKFLAGM